MKQQLKKGKYFIGDPSYLFDASWTKVLNETDFFNNEPSKINGKIVVAGSTAYGDGVYCDNHGREYGVDSGMIGILPISLRTIDTQYTVDEINKSVIMHIVDFKEDFTAECEKGKFKFGDIEINTTGDDEDEEEDFS
mgnify:CR=1 FL=1